VSYILSLNGAIRDDPSPDGTTAFAMAVSKGNSGIVEMLRKSKMETKEEMEVLFKASKELGPDPSQPIDKE
jgi:hypothetical protein